MRNILAVPRFMARIQALDCFSFNNISFWKILDKILAKIQGQGKVLQRLITILQLFVLHLHRLPYLGDVRKVPWMLHSSLCFHMQEEAVMYCLYCLQNLLPRIACNVCTIRVVCTLFPELSSLCHLCCRCFQEAHVGSTCWFFAIEHQATRSNIAATTRNTY